MQINEGGCLCSAIRFRISGEPVFSSICHCATCRRAGAAPTVAWLTFDRGQVEILSGTRASTALRRVSVRQFCGTCGSQLSYESIDESDDHRYHHRIAWTTRICFRPPGGVAGTPGVLASSPINPNALPRSTR